MGRRGLGAAGAQLSLKPLHRRLPGPGVPAAEQPKARAGARGEGHGIQRGGGQHAGAGRCLLPGGGAAHPATPEVGTPGVQRAAGWGGAGVRRPRHQAPHSLRQLFPFGGSVRGCVKGIKALGKYVDLKRLNTTGISSGCTADLLVGDLALAPGPGPGPAPVPGSAAGSYGRPPAGGTRRHAPWPRIPAAVAARRGAPHGDRLLRLWLPQHPGQRSPLPPGLPSALVEGLGLERGVWALGWPLTWLLSAGWAMPGVPAAGPCDTPAYEDRGENARRLCRWCPPLRGFLQQRLGVSPPTWPLHASPGLGVATELGGRWVQRVVGEQVG